MISHVFRTVVLTIMLAFACHAQAQDITDVADTVPASTVDTIYTLHPINQTQFKELIADWSKSSWLLKCPRPVVVAFTAAWCRPCKKLKPLLQHLAAQYDGTVDFYCIDVDYNPDVARALQIHNIPTLLICPTSDEQPHTLVGLYPEQDVIKAIDTTIGQ